MRIDTKMPAPAAAVAASSTITFKLPIGRRYHSLQLLGSGAGLSFGLDCLSEIRVLANSKVIQRFTGQDRNTMNLFDGREDATIDDDTFNLVLPFDRYGLLTKPGEEETALNTGSADAQGKSINQLSVEIDIAASGFTGTPGLAMYATQSEAQPGGAGTIPYILKSTRDYSAANTYAISDLPRGGVSTQFIDRIFLKPSTSTLENFLVEANSTKIFERTAALNDRMLRDGIRVPQAGWYVIDRTEHGYGGDPFDVRGLADWRLQLDTGAALTLKMYTHYLGGLSD
jgi:hypothetical protein